MSTGVVTTGAGIPGAGSSGVVAHAAMSPGLSPGMNPAAGAGTAAPSAGGKAQTGTDGLVEFEGFLKRAGHVAGVVLSDVMQYAIPLASLAAVADPATAPVANAFAASLKLVQATVVSAQQRWAADGSAANTQKLADVLEIVEGPIITMFAQVGVRVDTVYVTNLVNGVVAILNAQPGAVLPTGS